MYWVKFAVLLELRWVVKVLDDRRNALTNFGHLIQVVLDLARELELCVKLIPLLCQQFSRPELTLCRRLQALMRINKTYLLMLSKSLRSGHHLFFTLTLYYRVVLLRCAFSLSSLKFNCRVNCWKCEYYAFFSFIFKLAHCCSSLNKQIQFFKISYWNLVSWDCR